MSFYLAWLCKKGQCAKVFFVLLTHLSNIFTQHIKNLENYLNISIKSNFLHLYVCKNQSEIIGYALVADKPKYLISEFLTLKINIILNL